MIPEWMIPIILWVIICIGGILAVREYLGLRRILRKKCRQLEIQTGRGGPVVVSTRAHVTRKGRVIWSPAEITPIGWVDPQVLAYIEKYLRDHGMVVEQFIPSIVREQSKAKIKVYSDAPFLKANHWESYRILNSGEETAAYFLTDEFHVIGEDVYGKSRSDIFNAQYRWIKIDIEGGGSEEFWPTSDQMSSHLRHSNKQRVFSYPIVLEPKQSANIETERLRWEDFKGGGKKLAFMSSFRCHTRGEFEYEIVESPGITVPDIGPIPKWADFWREAGKTNKNGTRCWHAKFHKIIMPIMGIQMMVEVK